MKTEHSSLQAKGRAPCGKSHTEKDHEEDKKGAAKMPLEPFKERNSKSLIHWKKMEPCRTQSTFHCISVHLANAPLPLPGGNQTVIMLADTQLHTLGG